MPEGRVLTSADLASFPDDGLRRELIGGDLIVSASPKRRHQELVGHLFNALYNHLKAHPDGLVFVAPFDVVLSERDLVEPDVIFIAASQSGIVDDDNIKGVPSLVIEVVSNQRVDRVRKRDLYARFGVGEDWIVDPDLDRIDVLLLDGDLYAKPLILEPGETLATPLLPGLTIDLATLFMR